MTSIARGHKAGVSSPCRPAPGTGSRPPGTRRRCASATARHEEPSQVATAKPLLTDPSPSPPSGAHQRERHNLRAKVDSLRAAQY